MNGASVAVTGLDHPAVNLGVFGMSYLRRAIAAAALSLATLAPAGFAGAADMAVKAKPIIDVPFFFVIDNRVTYSTSSGTDPSCTHVRIRSMARPRSRCFRSPTSTLAYGTNLHHLPVVSRGITIPPRLAERWHHLRCSADCAGATGNIWPVPQHIC
jgi:hypothetical protein